MPSAQHKAEARERFQRSVTKAQLGDLLALVSGRETELLSFDEVAKRLKARQKIEVGTQMVRLDRIVGSVGRYRDFTRTFLPRTRAIEERWTRLDAAMNALESFPPVELFKIGEVYFVRDGNHRVSVARANGVSHIDAYVTVVKTDIPLTLDDFERDQWLIKVEYAEFLAETQLDQWRPGHELVLTEPGRYALVLDHIQMHHYLRNLDLARAESQTELNWQEAVESWYDNVYMPIVDAIRRTNLLEHFSHRTEADLYLWIAYHRERLAREYSLAPMDAETAVATFAEVYSDKPLERTLKGLRLGLHKLILDGKPLGMTSEEFQTSRTRHDAGEISLAEASEYERANAHERAVLQLAN